MEGVTFQPGHSSQGFHQVAGPSGHPLPLQDHLYVPIHGRYLSCTSFSFGNGENQRHQCKAPSSNGFHYQPQEIVPGSFSSHDPPWSPHRHTSVSKITVYLMSPTSTSLESSPNMVLWLSVVAINSLTTTDDFDVFLFILKFISSSFSSPDRSFNNNPYNVHFCIPVQTNQSPVCTKQVPLLT